LGYAGDSCLVKLPRLEVIAAALFLRQPLQHMLAVTQFDSLSFHGSTIHCISAAWDNGGGELGAPFNYKGTTRHIEHSYRDQKNHQGRDDIARSIVN